MKRQKTAEVGEMDRGKEGKEIQKSHPTEEVYGERKALAATTAAPHPVSRACLPAWQQSCCCVMGPMHCGHRRVPRSMSSSHGSWQAVCSASCG